MNVQASLALCLSPRHLRAHEQKPPTAGGFLHSRQSNADQLDGIHTAAGRRRQVLFAPFCAVGARRRPREAGRRRM
jgi:hypothetical protein